MISKVVVDGAVGISWAHPAQSTKATEALLEEVGRGTRVAVPTLWLTEVANALLVLERRKKLKGEERLQALATLSGLNPAGFSRFSYRAALMAHAFFIGLKSHSSTSSPAACAVQKKSLSATARLKLISKSPIL